MENLPAQILLQVVFILLNAFLLGPRCLLSLSPIKLSKQAEDGNKTAAALLKAVENPNSFLSGIQVAITLSGFLSAAFGTENFSGYLDTFMMETLALPLPAGVVSVISTVLVTLIISFFSIAFGEMVPKRIAMQQPEAWARMALGVMHGISVVFAPMMALLNVTTNGTLHLLGLKTEAEEAAASEERYPPDGGEQRRAGRHRPGRTEVDRERVRLRRPGGQRCDDAGTRRVGFQPG